MKVAAKSLQFVISYMKQNKKRKQTLESAQYGLEIIFKERSCLMVSTLDTPTPHPLQGHCVVFLGKTLYSHSASLHPGV